MFEKMNFFGVLLMLVVLLFGCSDHNNKEVEPIRNNNKSFYKEIYFGSVKNSKLTHIEGMKASRSTLSKTVIDEMERVESLLVDRIEEINPDFYNDFNEKIQSGDHLLIEKALNEGGEMLGKALYSMPELAEELLLGEKIANEIDVKNFLNSDGTLNANQLKDYIEDKYQDELAILSPTFVFFGVYVVAVMSVAVGVNYAGAINVYVWLNVGKWMNAPDKIHPGENSPIESDLQLEILVDEIATKYKRQ